MRGSKKKNTCENTNPKFIHINRHILIRDYRPWKPSLGCMEFKIEKALDIYANSTRTERTI